MSIYRPFDIPSPSFDRVMTEPLLAEQIIR
jgi:hypothetical protein